MTWSPFVHQVSFHISGLDDSTADDAVVKYVATYRQHYALPSLRSKDSRDRVLVQLHNTLPLDLHGMIICLLHVTELASASHQVANTIRYPNLKYERTPDVQMGSMS